MGDRLSGGVRDYWCHGSGILSHSPPHMEALCTVSCPISEKCRHLLPILSILQVREYTKSQKITSFKLRVFDKAAEAAGDAEEWPCITTRQDSTECKVCVRWFLP